MRIKIELFLKGGLVALVLLTASIHSAQAADADAIRDKAAELMDGTAEIASEVGSKLKDWGSQAWNASKDAASTAKETLDENGGEEMGETLKDIGSSLLDAGKRAVEATQDKMDELSSQREDQLEPIGSGMEGIAI